MAIVFPASPSTNDTFTAGSITYKWDGAKWIGLGVTPADRLVEGSNSLEIDANNNLVWTGNNVGIDADAPPQRLTIGDTTGYLNNHGIGVYNPHSLGLRNGVLAYNDRGYNNTASYRAAAFKAVGTTGLALGVSTDANTNGLGGTLNAYVKFDGSAYFGGNVEVADGFGIDFSSTSDFSGMTSEVLDNYEEGNWAPDLQFGGAKVGISYNNSWGRYIRIGKQVTVIGRFTLGSKGTSAGSARIFGLPYATESITGTQMSIGSLWYSNFNLQGSIVQVVIRTDGNNATFLEPKGVTTNAEDEIGDSDFTNNTDMTFTITYTTP